MFRRMKLRIFYATPKRTPGLSTNFSRRTRNFRCPALHFLSFADKLTLLSSRGPVCEVFLTNVNLSGKDKKSRAGHLKFLVRLKKLLETRGVLGGVSSKMRNFIRRKFVSMSPLVRGWMVLYTLYFPAHRHFQLFCSRYPSFLKNDQVLSSVIKCYEELSSVIKCYQGLSSVIKCYQVVSNGIIFYQV